jgi:hypothetical protein
MAGRTLGRAPALALIAAAAVGIGVTAAVAEGAGALKGSPAAVSVAQHVLAHARHVTALEWRQGGDQWECPSADGPIVGPAVKRPERGCHRATLTIDENLRDGRIQRSQSTTTARGVPTYVELATRAGDWTRTGRARCWDAQGPAQINAPAFSYVGERLSIAARTPGVISLRGLARGFRETDAIDAGSFAVREIDESVPGSGGTATLRASFTEHALPFALPVKPLRICSDVVRFPPYPAR